ncbi:hypothetical protein BST61_g9968 [Cercospora zeina]
MARSLNAPSSRAPPRPRSAQSLRSSPVRESPPAQPTGAGDPRMAISKLLNPEARTSSSARDSAASQSVDGPTKLPSFADGFGPFMTPRKTQRLPAASPCLSVTTRQDLKEILPDSDDEELDRSESLIEDDDAEIFCSNTPQDNSMGKSNWPPKKKSNALEGIPIAEIFNGDQKMIKDSLLYSLAKEYEFPDMTQKINAGRTHDLVLESTLRRRLSSYKKKMMSEGFDQYQFELELNDARRRHGNKFRMPARGVKRIIYDGGVAIGYEAKAGGDVSTPSKGEARSFNGPLSSAHLPQPGSTTAPPPQHPRKSRGGAPPHRPQVIPAADQALFDGNAEELKGPVLADLGTRYSRIFLADISKAYSDQARLSSETRGEVARKVREAEAARRKQNNIPGRRSRTEADASPERDTDQTDVAGDEIAQVDDEVEVDEHEEEADL